MKIVSAESLRVTTLSGAAIVFEADVETEVSSEVGLVALQMGAKEVKEGETKSEPEVVVEATEEPSDDLLLTLEEMMEEGDPDNFKADGTPKAAAVNKAMGKTIDTDTRDAAWESILNS
jgi:hypothetical protein|tara:strand:- start:14251 stop:14607 length:357 start_codon:yes stop_codon:yes gene_type:complete